MKIDVIKQWSDEELVAALGLEGYYLLIAEALARLLNAAGPNFGK